MRIRDLITNPVTRFDGLVQAVKADRRRALTLDLPLNAGLLIVSIPIHIKAKAANLSTQTVGSGVFVIASAVVMLFLALSTLIVLATLWLTRPSAPQESD